MTVIQPSDKSRDCFRERVDPLSQRFFVGFLTTPLVVSHSRSYAEHLFALSRGGVTREMLEFARSTRYGLVLAFVLLAACGPVGKSDKSAHAGCGRIRSMLTVDYLATAKAERITDDLTFADGKLADGGHRYADLAGGVRVLRHQVETADAGVDPRASWFTNHPSSVTVLQAFGDDCSKLGV